MQVVILVAKLMGLITVALVSVGIVRVELERRNKRINGTPRAK